VSTTTQQIQNLVQQALTRFEQLVASDDPPTQVLSQILEATVKATSALGGVVWMPAQDTGTGSSCRCVARVGMGALAVAQDQPVPGAGPILGSVVEQRKPVIVAPDSPEFQQTELARTAQFFVPVEAMGRAFGALQILAPAEVDPKVYRQYLAFVQQGARAAGMYLARRQAQVLSDDAASHANLLNVIHKLLQLSRPKDLVHELATTARGLLDAQRVAVIGSWRRGAPVAFSDTIEINRKAVVVRAVEMLAELVHQRQTPMTFVKGEALGEEDAALEPLLTQLFDLGAARAVCLTPIREGDRIIAVMAAEYAEPSQASRKASVQQELCRHAGPIISHTVTAFHRPLRRTSTLLAWVRRRPITAMFRSAAALALVAGLVYLLLFMPVDIVVRGDARLEPAMLAQITAPLDGRVKEVLVTTGQPVAAGQVLVQLDDTDLRMQLSEVDKRLAEEELSRRNASDKALERDRDATAARELAQLRIDTLTIERGRILQRIADAQIRSPIDGILLTEHPEQRQHMTVTKGTVLLAVADLGRFELVAELYEEDLALVDDALRQGRGVAATFLSRAWPDHPQHTVIESPRSLAPTSAPDEYQRQHVFRVITPIELQGISGQLALANPTGRAKLVTGQGSVIYRYGRGVWRFIQMTLLF
jgi:multidrug resistance efflux pump